MNTKADILYGIAVEALTSSTEWSEGLSIKDMDELQTMLDSFFTKTVVGLMDTEADRMDMFADDAKEEELEYDEDSLEQDDY